MSMNNLYKGDCLEVLKTFPDNSVESLITDPPAGISFMNKSWDYDKGGRDQWIAWMRDVMKECLRVMKPGAHGLVWAIPRTSHWTGTSLELAGFEVRDVITHLFGTGFPKSLDISKAIDKTAGAEREVVGQYASPEAKQWEGWGTALKPACEFWFLVRKPCGEKTVAANVLKWGTGGINIDAGRIETSENLNGGAYAKVGNRQVSSSLVQGAGMNQPGKTTGKDFTQPQGRFPANLVLDAEAATMLDEQSGVVASRFFYVAKASKTDKGSENTHPTVKSTKLMEYLIKLITPPNGIVLDPFMGSGSTGVACSNLGIAFVGIEKEQEYFDIAQKRVSK